eukprot:1379578-Amphidinium_carterae.1
MVEGCGAACRVRTRRMGQCSQMSSFVAFQSLEIGSWVTNLAKAEHSRSATLFVRSDASYSASPRRSSSLASDRRPVRDDLAAEILELRQETSRLWHSSPQRSARIHSEE